MYITRNNKSKINRDAHQLSLRFYEMAVRRLSSAISSAPESDKNGDALCQEVNLILADESDRIIDEYGF